MQFRIVAAIAAPFLCALTSLAQPTTTKLSAPLVPYTTCKLLNGPAVSAVTQMPPEALTHDADTLTGTKPVTLLDGARVEWSYPKAETSELMVVEALPAEHYDDEKAILTDEWEKVLARGQNNVRNYSLKPQLNGFDITGLDSLKLDDHVPGIYLLFDATKNVAATIYFFNRNAQGTPYASVDEYASQRDSFLNEFTACVRAKIEAKPPAPRPVAKASTTHRH